MDQITSRENPQVKVLHKLLRSRSERYRLGLFVIEGIKLAVEAIESGVTVEKLFYTREAMQKYGDSLQKISKKAEKIYEISNSISQKIADTKSPQGVYCICKMLAKRRNTVTIGNSEKFLGLVDLQDPGNIGTIIRTAEAMGIDGIFLAGSTVDIYNPKVLRSTMGSVFRVPIYPSLTPGELLQKLKQADIKEPSDDWSIRFWPNASFKIVATALRGHSVTLDSLSTEGSVLAFRPFISR